MVLDATDGHVVDGSVCCPPPQCIRYLTEQIYKKPVIVYNYPKDIKAFYMRLNDDGKTVAAMDVLVPKVGSLLPRRQAFSLVIRLLSHFSRSLERRRFRAIGF